MAGPLEVRRETVLGQLVEYHRQPNNWCAWTPNLPTILVGGPTLEDCRRRMLESIPWHLEALAADPAPRQRRHRQQRAVTDIT